MNSSLSSSVFGNDSISQLYVTINVTYELNVFLSCCPIYLNFVSNVCHFFKNLCIIVSFFCCFFNRACFLYCEVKMQAKKLNQ